MHLIKLIACKTLQSFQSVFYAQCNFQKKKRFLASFLMGTFGDAGRSMFPAPQPICRASFWGPKITRKPASCRGASTVTARQLDANKSRHLEALAVSVATGN